MLQTIMLILSSPVEITEDTFQKTVVQSGKMSFVKFYAPWCGHCKKLKPVWDQLSDLYDDSNDIIVGDVDCTVASSKTLCEKMNVKGFPSLKLFYPNSEQAEDYDNGRELNDLKAFIEEKRLLNSCTVDDQTNCSNSIKKAIKTYKTFSKDELISKQKKLQEKIVVNQEKLEFVLHNLQSTYESAMNTTKVEEDEIKDNIFAITKLLANSNKEEL